MPFKHRFKDSMGRSISVIKEETNEESLSTEFKSEQTNGSLRDALQSEQITKGNSRFRGKNRDKKTGMKLKNLLLKNTSIFKSFEVDEDGKTFGAKKKDSEESQKTDGLKDSQPKASVNVQYKRRSGNPKEISRNKDSGELAEKTDSVLSVQNCKVQINTHKSRTLDKKSLDSCEQQQCVANSTESPISEFFVQPIRYNWEDSESDDDVDDDDDDDDDDDIWGGLPCSLSSPYIKRTTRYSEGDIKASCLLNSPILNREKTTEKRRRNSTVTWKDLKAPIFEQKPVWLRTRRNAICEEIERDIQIQGLSLRQWRKIILTNFTLLDFDLRF